jgi:hypothetical protein
VKVKLLVPHKKDCWAVTSLSGNPWAYFTGEVQYRDAIGRKAQGAYHRWLVTRCNDDCPARLIVRERDVLAAAQAALQMPKEAK